VSIRTRIASFALALGAIFALAFLAGSAFEPADTEAGSSPREMSGGEHGDAMHGETGSGGHAEGAHGNPEGGTAPGPAVAAGGYTLDLAPTELAPGQRGELRFRIEDEEGAPVREFDLRHERRLHLIVVRRDGTGFQHLHPEMEADGTWAVPVTLSAAGVYRVFADFAVDGEPLTLATDIFSPGRFQPRPLPEPAPVAHAGGYEVRLAASALQAEAPAQLRFTVTRNGKPVALEDYLGARGHLVALRAGDLAFLHVHPDLGEAPPNVIPYQAEFPSAGRYRLFLQFKHAGQVRTTPFTVEVGR
jgi:hypothetical protein